MTCKADQSVICRSSEIIILTKKQGEFWTMRFIFRAILSTPVNSSARSSYLAHGMPRFGKAQILPANGLNQRGMPFFTVRARERLRGISALQRPIQPRSVAVFCTELEKRATLVFVGVFISFEQFYTKFELPSNLRWGYLRLNILTHA